MDPLTTLTRRGESVTVSRYSGTGNDDDYGDPELNETTTDTSAIVEMLGNQTDAQRRASGEQPSLDAVVYLDADIVVDDADDATRPSTITRALDNSQYRVETVHVEANGLQRCECARTDS